MKLPYLMLNDTKDTLGWCVYITGMFWLSYRQEISLRSDFIHRYISKEYLHRIENTNKTIEKQIENTNQTIEQIDHDVRINMDLDVFSTQGKFGSMNSKSSYEENEL